jgi:hypothetical protein
MGDPTVAKLRPLTLPVTFTVHRVPESIKDSPQQVPAHRNGALAASSDDPATCSETGRVTKRHTRHKAVSDSDDLGAKVHAFDPYFLADRSVDARDVEPQSDDALYTA